MSQSLLVEDASKRGELPPGRHFVFIYPQIKKLTGAQRLILALAGAVTALPGNPPNRVTLLTHRFAPECLPALPPTVQLIESGKNLNRSGNHYFDSLLEYGAVPSLLKRLPADTDAICFFGPPSLPGLWWAKRVRHLKKRLLYFCYEPPRAAYTDRAEVSRRMGLFGWLARPLLWAYRPLDKYLARQADAVLVNGEYGQSLIRQTYDLPSAIITHGVEIAPPSNLEEAVTCLRERYGLGDQRIVLTVNHLHPRKRLDLFLRSFALMAKEQPNVAALIVGTGPEEAALRNLATSLGLKVLDKKNPMSELRPQKLFFEQNSKLKTQNSKPYVIFAGFVPEADLAACYATAEVYVHTGRAESFGLAVLEAGAAGLPVVAVDEGGPREIIVPDETGFLVPDHPFALCQKIGWLLSHPEEAQAMGQRAAERAAACYTWERGAEAFVRSF